MATLVHHVKSQMHCRTMMEEGSLWLYKCIICSIFDRKLVGHFGALTGKYQFVEEHKFLEKKEVDWFKMTKEQRQKHMQKVATTQLAFTVSGPMWPSGFQAN